MPELPEVETVVRGLRSTILGKTIASIRLYAPKIDRDNPPGWLDSLKGSRFVNVRRRGKNILMDLNNARTLWVHLKMTGHFYFAPNNVAADKHDLLIINLRHDHLSLRFNDYRRFGRIRLLSEGETATQKGLADLGPDPLEISREEFISLCKSTKRMIKPALLDQTFLAGLGNIYSDESLYLSRIHPRMLTSRIPSRKLADLHSAIRSTLKKAVRLMGTSVNSFRGVDGSPGGYQKYLLVYGREGERCRRCGARLKREKIGSRSAHFCPRCQRLR
jgi:formamidopyrimidine-DNA glycosylase